jgi:V-type H+-transporting ATPase subunit d
MIDNVVNIMEGIKNKVDINILEASCDALGYFPEIRNIRVVEGDDYAGLYKDVLIDTPVGPYFMRFLEQSMESLDNKSFSDIMGIFKDEKTEKIRTSLKKMWLENFYDFIEKNLSGTS